MKRILSLLIAVLMIMGLVPAFSLAAEPATEDENAAINAEGSNLEFSFTYHHQWEVHYDEDDNPDYLMFSSPDSDSADDNDQAYAYVTVNMTAGQTFRGYYRVAADGVGTDDVYLRYYDEDDEGYIQVYGDENVATTDWKEMGVVAPEDGEYQFRITADFDSLPIDTPRTIDFMGFEVIDDERTYTISYVDYRTLETFHTEEVKPFAKVTLIDEAAAPVHPGFVFSYWDYEGYLDCITSDMTVYAMYRRAASVNESLDFSAIDLPEGTVFTNDETYPWTAELVDGIPTLVSGNREMDDSASTLSITVPAVDTHHLTFEYRVSSEEGYDEFFVSINGEIQYYDSGDSGWQTCIIPIGADMLSEGALTFDLVYEKDVSVSSNEDCVYVRNIEFKDIMATYTYIDGVSGETLKTEEVLSGSEPNYPEPVPVHEGMVFETWTESSDGYDRIYTARYLTVFDEAGNIEGGNLTIFEFYRVYYSVSDADLEWPAASLASAETEEGRSYIQLNWDESFDDPDYDVAPIVRIERPDLSSYTNPVLQFDFRIHEGTLAVEYYAINGTSGGLVNLYGCEEDGWQTVRIPLDKGSLLSIEFTAYTVGYIPFSEGALFDLDNICIVEEETEMVEVTIKADNESLSPETSTLFVPKYSYIDPYDYIGNWSEYTAFGFTENVRQITSDMTLYRRVLSNDLSAVLEEGSELAISTPYAVESLAFDIKTDEQGVAYLDLISRADAVKGGGSYALELQQENLTTDGSWICLDVKVGEGTSLSLYSSRDYWYSRVQVSPAYGEWVTLYLDATTYDLFNVGIQVEYGSAPDFQIKNIRYGQPQLCTLTIVSSLDETEVLGSYELLDGRIVDLMDLGAEELIYMIPDGYAISDVSSLRSIRIDGDTKVVLPLEAAIDVDEALNAPDKEIEFYNFPICQFTVETDGDRLVAVSNEGAMSFYDAWEYTSRIQTGWLELRMGDVISFEYKLPSISEGMSAYVSFVDDYDNSESYALEVTDEYRTFTWTVPEDGEYEIQLGYVEEAEEDGSIIRSLDTLGYKIYLDNFKIVPSTDEPVRGVYGQTLAECTFPENYSPVDGSLVLDVLNDGAEVLYTAPEGEKIYSSGVATAEVIILPRNLDSDAITVKGISRNGVVGDIALPEGYEWADAEAAITAYATELEIEGKISVEGLDEYNYTYSATPDEEGKIPVKILLTAYPLGDADLNGDIAAADAAEVLRHTVQLITLEGLGLEAGNVVPADPATNSADAAEILRFVVQLIDSF
ncbi:MAG: hypothetical protein Q4C01_07445 [Clostridia bacterium]|nr:hypothetical protein [Clostridia bacterium]